MATHGPSAFYANAPSANYPPIYPLVLWPIGALTPLVADVVGRDAVEVGFVLSKVPAVVADLGIALLLLTAGRRWWSPKVGIGAAALFPCRARHLVRLGRVGSGRLRGSAAGAGKLGPTIDRRPCLGHDLCDRGNPRQASISSGPRCPPSGAGPPPPRRPSRLSDLVPVCSGNDRGATRCLCALDLERFSHSRLADVPVAGDVTGLWALYRSAGETFDVLSVNAYNFMGSGRATAAGGIPGQRTGGLDPRLPRPAPGRGDIGLCARRSAARSHRARGGCAVAGAAGSGRRSGRRTPGPRRSAAAFFSVPTRVHERYLFPSSCPVRCSQCWRLVGSSRMPWRR